MVSMHVTAEESEDTLLTNFMSQHSEIGVTFAA